MDDHAAAQPHPIARRHRPSAHEAYRTSQRAGRQGVADVVEERRHEPQGGASAAGKCDLSVNRRAIAFAAVNPWFILGPVLAAWALILSFLGITREDFPGSRRAALVVGAISVVLVILAIGAAIYGGATEDEEEGSAAVVLTS